MSEGKAFYRCKLCATVVNGWDIVDGGGCPKCGALKVSPTNLSIWEMLVQLYKHPKIWDWPADQTMETAEFPAGHTKKWTPDGPVDVGHDDG